jgi:hypothetical protein
VQAGGRGNLAGGRGNQAGGRGNEAGGRGNEAGGRGNQAGGRGNEAGGHGGHPTGSRHNSPPPAMRELQTAGRQAAQALTAAAAAETSDREQAPPASTAGDRMAKQRQKKRNEQTQDPKGAETQGKNDDIMLVSTRSCTHSSRCVLGLIVTDAHPACSPTPMDCYSTRVAHMGRQPGAQTKLLYVASTHVNLPPYTGRAAQRPVDMRSKSDADAILLIHLLQPRCCCYLIPPKPHICGKHQQSACATSMTYKLMAYPELPQLLAVGNAGLKYQGETLTAGARKATATATVAAARLQRPGPAQQHICADAHGSSGMYESGMHSTEQRIPIEQVWQGSVWRCDHAQVQLWVPNNGTCTWPVLEMSMRGNAVDMHGRHVLGMYAVASLHDGLIAARHNSPGSGLLCGSFVRSWFVTLRPLRGPANTMRAQGPKPCPSNET